MRDVDVRAALHHKVLDEHRAQPDTLVIDELGLWYGTARVDIAVVNGRIHGFEIKSDRDTLDRLPRQAQIYSNVLDRVTLVVGAKHLHAARELVPSWWGLKVAVSGKRGAVHFSEERPPTNNPSPDAVAIAALLWREELTKALEDLGHIRGLRGKSRDRLTRRLVEVLPMSELRAKVREALRSRESW